MFFFLLLTISLLFTEPVAASVDPLGGLSALPPLRLSAFYPVVAGGGRRRAVSEKHRTSSFRRGRTSARFGSAARGPAPAAGSLALPSMVGIQSEELSPAQGVGLWL